MRYFNLLKESVRSGTIAALVMMPFGLLLRFLDLRVGYYGPKLGALLFGEPNRFVLFLQHLVIGICIGATSRKFVASEGARG